MHHKGYKKDVQIYLFCRQVEVVLMRRKEKVWQTGQGVGAHLCPQVPA